MIVGCFSGVSDLDLLYLMSTLWSTVVGVKNQTSVDLPADGRCWTVVGVKNQPSIDLPADGRCCVCRSRANSTDQRHYAAICMQSMYRRRMEEREKEAMATVFQPQPQRMYTGHRNSRTMVSGGGWGEGEGC